jgi:AraC family transcriptional regulator
MTDYIDRFIRALDFIEKNLNAPITLQDIAREACISSFHFTRVFHLSVGEPISAYIRKRRLTEAAKIIQTTDRGILDIALEFGFGSQAAFTRSFRKQFSITPARLKKKAHLIRYGQVEPLTPVQISHILHGGVTMQPRFVKRNDIILVGMKCENTMKGIRIPFLWGKFMRRRDGIRDMTDGTTYGVYLYDTKTEKSEINEDFQFEYLAAVEVHSVPEQPPRGMVVYRIPERNYAVFVHRGKLMEISRTYEYIYKTWLPQSGVDFLPAEHFEYHGINFRGDFKDSETEIFIPVQDE